MAPLFGCFIAAILISLFLLLFGTGVGVPWLATIATILVLYVIPALLTWRWMEIQKGRDISE